MPFPNATLDLADDLIGRERRRIADAEQDALKQPTVRDACLKGYGVAARDLEGAATNLLAFIRGTVPAECLPEYLAEAESAIARMKAALQ